MPLYEYKCHACGKTFEVIRKFSDEPLTIHPDCGGEVEQLVSAPAFHLKGTGWYATDYAKKSAMTGKAEDHKPDSKPEAGGETASPSTSETPAAPAAESKPAAAESKPAPVTTASDK